MGFGIVAAVLLAAAGLTFFWGRPARGLPELPDLAERSPILQRTLREADARARAWFADRGTRAALGGVYHANGFVDEALACWSWLAEHDPRAGRWPYYLAELARNRADADRMIEHLQETVRRDPTYSPAWLRLAELAFKAGRFEDAHAAYRRRLEREPNDPHARLGLARVAMLQGRVDEGRRALAELVRDTSGFSSAQNLYAQLLAETGNEEGAARHRWLGMVAQRFREADDPWLLELRAKCLDRAQLIAWASLDEQTQRPDRARSLFERAIELAPEHPTAYAELGQLLLNLGEREEALEVLRRGVERSPFDEKLSLRLSAALRELGRPAEALERDRETLAAAPAAAEVLNSLGQSQFALGDLVAAERTFRTALQHAPTAPSPHVNLGLVLLQTGRRTDARQAWEAAFEHNPHHPKLMSVLGQMALEDGRLGDAERVVRPYFHAYPGNGNARSLYARLHVARALEAMTAGDWAAAQRWCTAGLADVADAPDLLAVLGSVRLQRGEKAGAVEAFEASRRQLPGDPRVVMPLAMLYAEMKRPADARRVLLEARDWLQKRGATIPGAIESMLKALPAPERGRAG